MAIKFKAKSKDEIPAELQSLYVERDGAFVLDVEGAVDRARVDEVRESERVGPIIVTVLTSTISTLIKPWPVK
jgi:hypothetical protein